MPPKPRAARAATPKLDAAALEANRHCAPAYSMRRTYAKGEWIDHPKFGVGQVISVVEGGSTPQVEVLFEGFGEKRLVHARS